MTISNALMNFSRERGLPPEAVRAEIQAELARREADRQRTDVERNAGAIRARCQTLAGFVREAWHVLEPNARYVHNWHIDVICLPYDSEIVTRDGTRRIGDIVENSWSGDVLSLDHATGHPEWRP